MSLGLSVKEKMDKKIDISKLSREELEVKYHKKVKILKYVFLMFIIFSAMMLYIMLQVYEANTDLSNTKDALEICVNTAVDKCAAINNGTISTTGTSQLVTTITSFFKWITQLDQPYFFRLMILLGMLYSLQILFAVVIDIIEVILLVFVMLKKIIMWIVRLVKPKDLNTTMYRKY